MNLPRVLLWSVAVLPPFPPLFLLEDTPALTLPHEHWLPAVSRPSFAGDTLASLPPFSLLLSSFLPLPYLLLLVSPIVRSAPTLFPAMATGHGGFSSIHADSVEI